MLAGGDSSHKNWSFEKFLNSRGRREDNQILRQILVEVLGKRRIPAHLEDRAYDKWIVASDASIYEPPEKDGDKRFCRSQTCAQLYESAKC